MEMRRLNDAFGGICGGCSDTPPSPSLWATLLKKRLIGLFVFRAGMRCGGGGGAPPPPPTHHTSPEHAPRITHTRTHTHTSKARGLSRYV
jgi:hypothetical protein